MKKAMGVLAVLLAAGAAYAALQDGDFVVANDNDVPAPAPGTSSILAVKADGSVESLRTFGPWEWIGGVAVHPDGGIVAVREGNYTGGPTPTQFPVGPGTPTPTPYPPGYWRESAIYRVQPDGSAGIIASGGKLNPAGVWNNSIERAACDAQGNIFVLNQGYQPPASTPGPYTALLKVAPDGTVTEFASGGPLNQQPTLDTLAVSASGDIFMAQPIWLFPAIVPPGNPTPMPARLIKADSSGALSVVATTTLANGPPPSFISFPPGTLFWWSTPFELSWGIDFDASGRPLVIGLYVTDYTAFLGITTAGIHAGVSAVNPDGSFSTVLDADALVGALGQNGFCLDGQGRFVGANDNSIFRIDGDAGVSFLASGPPFTLIDDLKFYPPATPPFETWFSEALLTQGEGVAVGFDIARGRQENTADLYFGIRFPASAGGDIRLFNPNAAANGFPLLIPLDLAQRYPGEVAKLRYGNGTTTVQGAGSTELGSFGSVSGIPTGTYQFLGVMTEPGASLFDSSKWRTPGGQPVSAECVYIGTL
jgi:hypothetical protein